MFCENCGYQLRDGAVFCPKCGAKTDDDAHPEVGNSSVSASAAPESSRKQVMNKTQCGKKKVFIPVIIIVLICVFGAGGFIIWKTCFSHSNYYRDIPWGASHAEVKDKMDGYNWEPIYEDVTRYETDGYLGIDLMNTETSEYYCFSADRLEGFWISLYNAQEDELRDAVEKKLMDKYGEPVVKNIWKTKDYIITLKAPGKVGIVDVDYEPND